MAPGQPCKTRRARGGGLVAIQMGSREREMGQNMLITAVAKVMLCLILKKSFMRVLCLEGNVRGNILKNQTWKDALVKPSFARRVIQGR